MAEIVEHARLCQYASSIANTGDDDVFSVSLGDQRGDVWRLSTLPCRTAADDQQVYIIEFDGFNG
ncbi:hypothetical protein D3C75_1175310 [compost metagenome]